ncbi:MAG: BamA/TamA family outer membrane protein [Polyangiaceae bacterium]|nr:BamA/TamA family outer membrane protein [Polyangiaceae bacterium]MCW5790665.1 BamA/TamA family outer membrane protein [Polyangiaceae bacterium]
MASRWELIAALTLLLVGVTLGCAKSYPAGRSVVSGVEIENARAVEPSDLLAGLATTTSSRFLGIWEGVVFDYEVFDEDVLARDLLRVERYYRARGYYEAKVSAARVIRVGERRVHVQIRVEEGSPVVFRQYSVSGVESTPGGMAALRAVTLREGVIFDEAQFEESKQGIGKALADMGYAFVTVDAKALVDIANHSATAVFQVQPGPPAKYGKIHIQGHDDLPEDVLRAAIKIREGDDYSHADLEAAQTALVELGVFATVDVRQDTTKPESGKVPITIIVRPSHLRALKLGGGVRFDSLRLSSHLRAGWEHRNFLGGLRRFSIDGQPGVVFFPTRVPSSESSIQGPSRLLFETTVRSELSQPSFLEGRTRGILTAEYLRYPLLYEGETDDQESNIVGFNELRFSAGVERAFFSQRAVLRPSYNIQTSFPFSYNDKDLRDGVDEVIVSFPELLAVLDFRDRRMTPRNGATLRAAVQVAGYLFGGDASDVRLRPEATFYKSLSRRVVLAVRTSFGFLFPSNYESALSRGTPDINDPAVIRNQQVLLFRGFFSGGPTSNRGYPYRGVGPHGVLGFLIPNETDCAGDSLPSRCTRRRPLGGLTLWEASLEARFDITQSLSGALFLDGSDVTSEVASIRFDFPHLSAGPGVRYQTPVGAIRADIGYRLPFAQEIGEANPRPEEGNPGTILGLPIAIHLGLGEAF